MIYKNDVLPFKPIPCIYPSSLKTNQERKMHFKHYLPTTDLIFSNSYICNYIYVERKKRVTRVERTFM